MYRNVFPEPEFEPMRHDGKDQGSKIDSRKIYKIKYTVNLLPQIGPHWLTYGKELKFVNEEVPLLDLIIDHDELEKYDSSTLQQLITYKWNTYGYKHHLTGCVLQFFSTIIIIVYIGLSYLQEPDKDTGNTIPIMLGIAAAYPAFYESF